MNRLLGIPLALLVTNSHLLSTAERTRPMASAVHGVRSPATASPGMLAPSSEFALDLRVISLQLRDEDLADDASPAVLQACERAFGRRDFEIVRRNRLGILDVAIPSDLEPATAAARLADTGCFRWVEVNHFARFMDAAIGYEDPALGSQWSLENHGQTGGREDADIDAFAAWEVSDGSPDLVIAVIDSGIDWSHPDLSAAAWWNAREVPSNGIDDDTNGFIDDVVGFDFGDDDAAPFPADSHGTAIAGIAVAVGRNGIGIAGVAGGGRDGVGCRVMDLKLTGANSASSVLDDAIVYAIDNGARVLTLSLAIPPSAAVHAALHAARSAGLWVQCSAGNQGGVTYPASDPEVVAIGGTDHDDRAAGYSSGNEILLAAPATDIVATLRGGAYGTVSGTSFAAPIVAGAVALVWSVKPDLTAEQVRAILCATADDVGPPGRDTATGFGRINANAAVRSAERAIAPLVAEFGRALPGPHSSAPRIRTAGGEPRIGVRSFRLRLDGAPPNAAGYLTLTCDLDPHRSMRTPAWNGAARAFSNPVSLPVRTDALGGASVPLDLPSDPNAAGVIVRARFWIIDPATPLGLVATRGLEVRIGS